MATKNYEYTHEAAKKMVADGLMDQAIMDKKIKEGLIEPSPMERRILELPEAVQDEARVLVNSVAAKAPSFREKGNIKLVLQFRTEQSPDIPDASNGNGTE